VSKSHQHRDQFEMEAGIKGGEPVTQNDQWKGLASRSTVPIEKAATLLDASSNTILTLRNKGVLKTAALNKQLITVASLKAYDLKRSQRKKARHTDEIKPRLRVVNS
jgi:hypothetical protein